MLQFIILIVLEVPSDSKFPVQSGWQRKSNLDLPEHRPLQWCQRTVPWANASGAQGDGPRSQMSVVPEMFVIPFSLMPSRLLSLPRGFGQMKPLGGRL